MYKPPGAHIWRGDLTEGFLRYRFGGLMFGGGNTCRSLFSEFYGIFCFILKKRISIWIAASGKYKKCSLLASCTL